MRTSFMVGISLLGIYLLCEAFTEASSLAVLTSQGSAPFDFTYFVQPTVAFALGCVLVLGRRRFTLYLGIPDTPIGTAVGEQAALRMGILLLGLFLFVGGLSGIFETILSPLNPVGGWLAVARRFIRIFALLTPLYLIFGADRIARMLWPRSTPVESDDTVAAEFVKSGLDLKEKSPRNRKAYR